MKEKGKCIGFCRAAAFCPDAPLATLLKNRYPEVINSTREIGIRKVFGASIPVVILLLTREFVKWVIVANIIAWPAAYIFMNKWLQNFACRIDLGVGIFLISGLAALCIVLIAISSLAVKAALANPADSLRYE